MQGRNGSRKPSSSDLLSTTTARNNCSSRRTSSATELSRTIVGAATFGQAPLVRSHKKAVCSVHSYSQPASSFSAKDGAMFSGRRAPPTRPPTGDGGVHCYVTLTMNSTLRARGVAPFSQERRHPGSSGSGPAVHSYRPQSSGFGGPGGQGSFGKAPVVSWSSRLTPGSDGRYVGVPAASTLRSAGVAPFSSVPRKTGRDAAECPVHSYAAPRSTLSKGGVAGFSREARHDVLKVGGRSRTGLVSAPASSGSFVPASRHTSMDEYLRADRKSVV